MQTAMYVNDFDTSSLGLIVTSVDGWRDAPSTRDRTTQLPTRVGAVILAPEAETAPRVITVDGVIDPSHAGKALTLANLRAAISELQERLYRGTIEVRFADEPDIFVLARCEQGNLIATPPQFMNPKSRVQIRMLCPDPLRYDRNGSVVGFGASPRAGTPLGTAVSAPVIRIMGAATNPVITYRNMSGDVKQTMGFTVTLAATDYLEIDCELFTIKKFASGVETNGISLLTSGDFIALDPQDGDYAGSVWPTLEVNAGSGECLYRRAWL
jgi:phage-related protein